ncbi:hypothetical protein WNY37_04775 [Henriciella sp. AS95]|uniref:ImuA family protein n=1 Tax=Henriciella sp. AS95 TaxID=3135782 RepID=UPI00316B291D
MASTLDLQTPGIFRLGQAAAPREPAQFPLGLGTCGVHEICETSFGDMPALTGFALSAAPARRGAIIWVSQSGLLTNHGNLLETGLRGLRRERADLLHVHARKLPDTLWAIEEAIRSSAAGLVIGELSDMDFTASRRLALASSRHGIPVVLLMPYTREGATASIARWRVMPRPSAPNRYDRKAPGNPRWQANLERSRQAPHMAGHSFDVEFDDETLSLTVVSGLAADTPSPGETVPADILPLRRTG